MSCCSVLLGICLVPGASGAGVAAWCLIEWRQFEGGRQHLKLSVQHVAYLVSCFLLPRQDHHANSLSHGHPQYPLEITPISLDNMSFLTAPALQGAKATSQHQQRHFKEPWTQIAQMQGDQISIPSNSDSIVSAVKSRHTDQDDGEDSDSTLPSISAIIASLAKVRPGKSSQKATQSEDGAGLDAAAPGQAEAPSAWPDETQLPPLVNMRGESCEIDFPVTGDIPSSPCVNLGTPTTKSQPNSVMIDAVFDYASNYSPTCVQPPRTASRAGDVQASVRESEIPAGNLCDDGVPGACITSIAPLSPRPYEGGGLDDATCASTLLMSAIMKASPRAEAEVSATVASPPRFGRLFLLTHEKMQSKDNDMDNQGSGSEGGLGELRSRRGGIFRVLPSGEDSSSDDDDAHQSRKRRKVSKSSSYSARHNCARSRSHRSSRQR